MNTIVQREVLDWYKEWNLSCTREQLSTLTRGPFRDFQLTYLLPLAKTNAYQDTFRTNVYLQEGIRNNSDFLRNEIDTTIFATKLAALQHLNAECNLLKSQISTKEESLFKQQTRVKESRYAYKKDYHDILVARIDKTKAIVSECEKLATANELESENSAKTSHLPALTDAAHFAIQNVILRHYLYERHTSPRLAGSPITAEEFNTLVCSVINEDACMVQLSDWINKERKNGIKSCESFSRKLLQDKNTGLQHNMSEKMKELTVSWSALHVQVHFKNKARSKMLSDVERNVEEKKIVCTKDANVGFWLSDFLVLLLERRMKAKVFRCRQQKNQSNKPLENIFKNISTDHFSTPSPEHVGSFLQDNRRNSSIKEWIHAVSDQEHIEEIYVVLTRTWKLAQKNLVDMIAFAQQPNNEILPSLLQTAESIKMTRPKHLSAFPEFRPRTTFTDIYGVSGSMLSTTRASEQTFLNSTTNTILCDSFNESRSSTSTKDSDDFDLCNSHLELFKHYSRIDFEAPLSAQAAVEEMLKSLLVHEDFGS